MLPNTQTRIKGITKAGIKDNLYDLVTSKLFNTQIFKLTATHLTEYAGFENKLPNPCHRILCAAIDYVIPLKLHIDDVRVQSNGKRLT